MEAFIVAWWNDCLQQFERLFMFGQKVENLLLSVEPEQVCFLHTFFGLATMISSDKNIWCQVNVRLLK